MKKFIIYTDFAHSCDYSYQIVECDNLVEAIIKADNYHREYQKNNRPVYLMQILEKDGKQARIDGYHAEPYKAVLCKRSGWNTMESEAPHTVNLCWYGKLDTNDCWVENTTWRGYR